MKLFSAMAIAATLAGVSALPVEAAAFSDLNQNVVKFSPNTSEIDLIQRGAASVTVGNATIYIGTNQVSAIDQNPIVASYTNGQQNWVQSYDTSGIDGRGIGLLWDVESSGLYGVFTADGGSQGADTFGAATQGGWLSSYGQSGGPVASVLLKLNPSSGETEAGTYIRAKLGSGDTNTVRPTGLDFVNGEVVFFGDSFFVPLDASGVPFTDRDEAFVSPFEYRVVLSANLAQATSAEAIGWNGVTEFTPLTDGEEADSPDSDAPEDSDSGETADTGDTGDHASDGGSETGEGSTPVDGGDLADDVDSGETAQPVPEPGVLMGLITVLAIVVGRRSRSTFGKSA